MDVVAILRSCIFVVQNRESLSPNGRSAADEYTDIMNTALKGSGNLFDRSGQRASFSARHFYMSLARAFGVFTGKNVASIVLRARTH